MQDYYKFKFGRILKPHELQLEAFGFYLGAGLIALLFLVLPLTNNHNFNNFEAGYVLFTSLFLVFLTFVAEDFPRFCKALIVILLLLFLIFSAVCVAFAEYGIFWSLVCLYYVGAIGMLGRSPSQSGSTPQKR